MRKLFFLILGLVLGVQLLTAAPYKISYLTADNGLSRNLVDHIYSDSHGFVWFSTSRGLDRYDGYEFVHFNSRNRVNPLPTDNVHCVIEDKNSNMWIGTENGLYYLDYKTGVISTAKKILQTLLPFASQQIIFLEKDEHDNVWIGHVGGLSKLNFSGNEIFVEDILKSNIAINSILFYNESIYISHESQVSLLIKGINGKYQRIAYSDKLNNFPGIVNTLFGDNGLVWIGTANGLFKYDPQTENLSSYVSNVFDANSLSSNYITDIKKEKDGQLLIGTLIGLNFYDYHTDVFTKITNEPNSNGTALNNNFVNCLLAEDNIIWIGTDKGGVNVLTPEQNLFYHLGNIPGNSTSLSKNPVNAIYEDYDNDLFVGTVEGGLNIRKKGTSSFIHSQSEFANSKSLSHNSVSCICQDYKGDYWVGTWGLGLNRLKYKDKYKPVFDRFTADGTGLANNFLASLVPDNKRKGLWIGMREGLDYLDLQSSKFYHILNFLPTNESLRFVTGMLIDSKNRLWVGTGYGLYCIYLDNFDLQKNRIRYKYFKYLLTNPTSGIYEKINCITETKDHRIWFGSNGNGIYVLKESGDEMSFVNYDENSGLLDNIVYGLLEDEAGTLWISSDKGLCAFNSSRNSIKSYTKADGLKSNQFYWDAYFKGRDGKMYFGNVSGLTYFDPLKTSTSAKKSIVSITSVKILNEDVFPIGNKNNYPYLVFENTNLVGINLRESDKAFSVEFSALSFNQADKLKYSYRLKGFDDNWTDVSSDRRFASFTNIKRGNYVLEIKCINPDGAWSDIITSLNISVKPPFYKTWWFLMLVLIVILYVVYSYYIYRINSLKKQETHLRQLVNERTHEIGLQKEKLEGQAVELQINMKELIQHQEEVSRQNVELIYKNEEITSQKEELEQLTKKVEEATFDKISFFTNITHEFRTPITLILGPVERSLKLSTNPKVLEQLNIVKRNSRLLLSLVNQLMDFRKIDSNKLVLTKTNQNFVEFLEDIILPFEDLVKDRGIKFRKQYRIQPSEFLFDKESMQKVLSNLLSNAIKFTPDRGVITVIASTYTDKSDQKERLYVAVKDTGNGVAVDDLEAIFDRFFQSGKNESYSGYGQSGTGIGLYLCKHIIQLYNGKIEAINLQSGGACFRFIIPIERKTSTVVALDGIPMEIDDIIQLDEHDSLTNEIISKNKPVLLIVEDNSDMRQFIRSIMISDFNVLEAANGLIGLEVTNRYQPDLIISDIMMPEMDGLEFCKRVKSSFTTSHIPVILLTAKSSTDTQIESFNIGADAFLVKPFDEDVLKAMILNMSEKKNRIQMSFSENMDTEALNFDDESLDKKFMDKALKVIKENYMNPDFDVVEFIDAMGISRSLLHKKLKNFAGQSASRFIRIYRLNIAREIIIKNRISHSLNISEIAYQVGFNDPKYFTRCFTKHFGTQPSTFLEDKNEA